jgi:uncharacterized repeat protein (TIGR01451 family)
MTSPRQTKTKMLMAVLRKGAAQSAFMATLALAGSNPVFATIDNTAQASGDYNGTPVQSDFVTVKVPVALAYPALEITKVASPRINVAAGTEVTYTYTVKNSGNATLTNISLDDVHQGGGTAPVPGDESLLTDVGLQNDSTDATTSDGVWSVLAPGDTITFTSKYIVVQSDVDTKQ